MFFISYFLLDHAGRVKHAVELVMETVKDENLYVVLDAMPSCCTGNQRKLIRN